MNTGDVAASIGRQQRGVATVTSPGARSQGAHGGQMRGTGLPDRAGDDRQPAEVPLVRIGGTRPHQRRGPAPASAARRVRPSRPSMTSYGMPMSAITTSPAYASPGGNTSGSFGAASVTVSDASMQSPIR